MRASENIIRILSKLGVCSRKQAVEYVHAGRVKVNGITVLVPGAAATLSDKILIDGKPPVKKELLYLLFHKPAGCITTRKDELGRKTVYDYLGDIGQWVFPVGRLDLESEGLLLFTNDTELGNRLTDPSRMMPRTYTVTLDGPLPLPAQDLIRAGGVDIGRGEKTGPATIRPLKSDDGSVVFSITISEGKNRELRRLFESFGLQVLRLVRTNFGTLNLGGIEPGHYRKCSKPKM